MLIWSRCLRPRRQTSPEALAVLCEWGISHVYIGQTQGATGAGVTQLFGPEELLSQPAFHLVYQQDRVHIFALATDACETLPLPSIIPSNGFCGQPRIEPASACLLGGSPARSGNEFRFAELTGRWGYILAVLCVGYLGYPRQRDAVHWVLPWLAAALGVTAMVLIGLALVSASAPLAWIGLGLFYAVLLQLDAILAGRGGRLHRLTLHLLPALCAGALPVILNQMQGRFSDEEFFVALQVLALSVFWLLLLVPYRRLVRAKTGDTRSTSGVLLSPMIVGLGGLVFVGVFGVFTLRMYQGSFFAPRVAVYEGISAEKPFLCGEVAPDAQRYDGSQEFARLLAAVEANPHKGTPEYGMLALGTREERWAKAFRDSLLQEAAEMRYSRAANSVKAIQYSAALRAYYLSRSARLFPTCLPKLSCAHLRNGLAQ